MTKLIKTLQKITLLFAITSLTLLIIVPNTIGAIGVLTTAILLLVQTLLEVYIKRNDDTFYFAKIKGNGIIPSKRDEDGCYDLYACINEDITIPPHTNKLIPTDLASAFNQKYRVTFRERGTNTKYNGVVLAGQIDSGYRNEYFISIYNGNDIPVIISNNAKDIINYGDCISFPTSKAICQFAIEEVPKVKIIEKDYEFIKNIDSERGMGCLGSSKK